jgi:hypothetical protein
MQISTRSIKRAGLFMATAVLGFTGGISAMPQGPAQRPDDATVWMLWYGSSSAYFHEFYRQVADWVSRGGPKAAAGIVGRSGTGVDDYLEPDFQPQYGLAPGETVLGKITEGKPKFVGLQIVTYFLGREGREDRFSKTIDTYCKAAREVGAKVYLFEQGWDKTYGLDTDSDRGVRLEIRSALRNDNAVIAPCRRAWLKAYAGAEKAGVQLRMQDPPDSFHPGLHGLYLNLCVFYAAVTGKSPVGLPPTLEHSAFELEKNAEGKDVRGPLKPTTIDAKVAEYLQKVAWESWQEAEVLMKGLREQVAAGKSIDDLEIPWPPKTIEAPAFLK